MIVRVTDTKIVVEDRGDLTRLHVATRLDADAVNEVLVRLRAGCLTDDGSTLLDLAFLRVHAEAGGVGDDWGERWQAMIDYAARKGWLSADGRLVRAHVEWTV